MTNLNLVVGSKIFKTVCKAICFTASLIFSRWKDEAIFIPLLWLHYCWTSIFVEFALHFKSMKCCIWSNLEFSILSIAKIEIFLAGCGVCVKQRCNIFFKLFWFSLSVQHALETVFNQLEPYDSWKPSFVIFWLIEGSIDRASSPVLLDWIKSDRPERIHQLAVHG